MPVASGDEILRYAQDDGKVDEHDADALLRVSADIRHNIAQFCQAVSLHDVRKIILSYR
jgi:hypothetical protein